MAWDSRHWWVWAFFIAGCERGATTIKARFGASLHYPITRDKLLALNFALLIANAMPIFASESVALRGWFEASINLFDISAIIWLAVIACLSLLWHSEDTAPTRRDWVFTAGAALVALAPFSVLSGAALTVAGLWGIFSSPAGTAPQRASAIILSLATFFFWGRMFLALGSGPLLSADAQFVSWISGLPATGNIITSVDGEKFVIAPGCSSLHGISLALILWTTALAWFVLPVTPRMLMLLGMMLAASILVNALRLAVIGWYPADFDYWHVGSGAMLFGWIALISVTAILYMGMQYDRAKT